MSAAVAIATCEEVAELDAEGRLLLAELERAGVDAEAEVWSDPDAGWDRFELVVLRSTWDYPQRLEQFLAWTESIGERLLNPPALVRWNCDKRYLAELAAEGLAVVPSVFAAPGEELALPAGEVVVKPAVGAGSNGAARFAADEHRAALAHARSLLAAGRDVLAQPYLSSVDSVAETAAVFLGGEYSHAISKGALLEAGGEVESGLFKAERIEPREPAPDELELASAALAFVAGRWGTPLYGRVDMLRDGDGRPLILELELIEPSLFLDHHPPAARRLAALIADRYRRER